MVDAVKKAEEEQCSESQHAIIEYNQTQEEEMSGRASPILISSDSEGYHVEPAQNEDGDTVSPALSYLTLDEHPRQDAPPEGDIEEQQVAESSAMQATHPVYASDDTESSEDDELDSSDSSAQPAAVASTALSGTDLLVQRLLDGDEASDVLKDVPAEQRSRVLTFLNMGALSQSTNRAAEQNSSESSDDVGSSDSDTDEPKDRRRPIRSLPALPAVSRSGRARKSGIVTVSQDSHAEDDGVRVLLPKPSHAKGRRILVPSDRRIPIAAVYIHGDLQFIDQTNESIRHVLFQSSLTLISHHCLISMLQTSHLSFRIACKRK
ncbi:hypothetical protein BC835DRAFT_38860 [Cytidiella melzeri]|nr:hypothetical protein BC835DRAFT_38860 [Cytidiella melzeri]